LLIGSKTYSKGSVGNVTLKGVDKGKPMLFLTQNIDYEMDETKGKPSLVEERAHVYFEVKDEHEESKPPPKCKYYSATLFVPVAHALLSSAVQGIPTSVDFSFTYVPSVITLFRFSALMFNAHHIHLDKEYSQKKERYPGNFRILFTLLSFINCANPESQSAWFMVL
jgi:sphingosine kinase